MLVFKNFFIGFITESKLNEKKNEDVLSFNFICYFCEQLRVFKVQNDFFFLTIDVNVCIFN